MVADGDLYELQVDSQIDHDILLPVLNSRLLAVYMCSLFVCLWLSSLYGTQYVRTTEQAVPTALSLSNDKDLELDVSGTLVWLARPSYLIAVALKWDGLAGKTSDR